MNQTEKIYDVAIAGGGIVAGSVPSEELAETARKFLPMYEALSPVDRP